VHRESVRTRPGTLGTQGNAQTAYILAVALLALTGVAGLRSLGGSFATGIAGDVRGDDDSGGRGTRASAGSGHGASPNVGPSSMAGVTTIAHAAGLVEVAKRFNEGTRVPWREVTYADLAAKDLEVVARVTTHLGGSGGGTKAERWTVRAGRDRTFDVAVKFGEGLEANAIHEEGYYRLDQSIGGDTVVPPTTARELPGGAGFGSMQVWVDSARRRALAGDDEFALLKNPRLKRIAVLDYFTGHLDRHPDNLAWPIDGDDVSAIDAGYAFDRIPVQTRVKTPLDGDARYSWFLYRPTDEFTNALRSTNLGNVARTLAEVGIDADVTRAVLRRMRSMQAEPQQFEAYGKRIGTMRADNWDEALMQRYFHPDGPLPGLGAAEELEVGDALRIHADHFVTRGRVAEPRVSP
jgi:hypothetical protein